MSDIYNRNVLTWGTDNQKKLSDYNVLVVGSDILSQYLLANLAGMGIGKISLIDNDVTREDKKDFLCSKKNSYSPKVGSIGKTLEKINSNLRGNIQIMNSGFSKGIIYDALRNNQPNLIVDCTNDPETKENSLKYAYDHGIDYISASSSNHNSSLTTYYPKLDSSNPDLDNLVLSEFENVEQGGFPSGVVAPIIAEEIRKQNFSYNDIDKTLESNQRLNYDLFSKQRTSENIENLWMPTLFRGKKVLVVGAGGGA